MGKKKKEVEKNCQNFVLEKDGKETEITSCEDAPKKITEGQIKNQNKQLKGILIFLGAVLVLFIFGMIAIQSSKNFEYNGVKYQVIREGDVTFYNTIFPYYSPTTGKVIADYNIYLRNNPRDLRTISFDGNFLLTSTIVINFENEFNCDGDGAIAMANFVQIFNALGIDVLQDPEAECDSQGRYTRIIIQESITNESNIKQTSENCYEFNIANCEILKVTEKFITKTLEEIN